MTAQVRFGDCLDHMRAMAAAGEVVSAIVTDPPYGLRFMGKAWDHGLPPPETWRAAFDLLPPGGHLIAFGGTRTYHRLASAIEDAGFEIRDQLGWLFGTGFPKSLDVGKAIDRDAGAVRETLGPGRYASRGRRTDNAVYGKATPSFGEVVTAPATDLAAAWDGWGTALKPGWEPICLARKPLVGTVAQNIAAHGVGAINVDGCRIPSETPIQSAAGSVGFGADRDDGYRAGAGRVYGNAAGRWPANVAHDGSPEVEAAFAAFGVKTSGTKRGGQYGRDGGTFQGNSASGMFAAGGADGVACYADSGTAARFFYCAKASRQERDGSKHPTVKPLALMRWLVRLITPPGGIVLDPFAGTGTTLAAALAEGFRAVGIEREAEYIADIRRRLLRPVAELSA